ncbi:hypothetical protein CSUI_003016 [Cystoisospora suis]|uniref:Transmembrane protein n=1 Tax=Cystoisospora suis TaxID=483139 RepID=A0A2C6L6L9_9APIC|nr:hypothetical protein CSUI_003016 [Cystoisospora suis]
MKNLREVEKIHKLTSRKRDRNSAIHRSVCVYKFSLYGRVREGEREFISDRENCFKDEEARVGLQIRVSLFFFFLPFFLGRFVLFKERKIEKKRCVN